MLVRKIGFELSATNTCSSGDYFGQVVGKLSSFTDQLNDNTPRFSNHGKPQAFHFTFIPTIKLRTMRFCITLTVLVLHLLPAVLFGQRIGDTAMISRQRLTYSGPQSKFKFLQEKHVKKTKSELEKIDSNAYYLVTEIDDATKDTTRGSCNSKSPSTIQSCSVLFLNGLSLHIIPLTGVSGIATTNKNCV